MEKPFGRQDTLTTTLIIACPKCAKLLLAKQTQKTRSCPYCGTTIQTQKARKLAQAPNPYIASEMMRQLKTDKTPPKTQD
jgi:predicted RNA-binding Zn-ribbon protein involved in translation (DUF1610 family)